MNFMWGFFTGSFVTAGMCLGIIWYSLSELEKACDDEDNEDEDTWNF